MRRESLTSISQMAYGSVNAIGPETYHGQHRGTGAGLQATANRLAGIIVSLLRFRCFFLKLDDGNRF